MKQTGASPSGSPATVTKNSSKPQFYLMRKGLAKQSNKLKTFHTQPSLLLTSEVEKFF